MKLDYPTLAITAIITIVVAKMFSGKSTPPPPPSINSFSDKTVLSEGVNRIKEYIDPSKLKDIFNG